MALPVYMCLYMWLFTEARKSLRSPRMGITGSYELPEVSSGTQTLVLGKNRRCF